VRDTGICVQPLVVIRRQEELSSAEIAEDDELAPAQVETVLCFYAAHQTEIEHVLEAEQALEAS
jgi:uncharacterized protein (DUF433 family)